MMHYLDVPSEMNVLHSTWLAVIKMCKMCMHKFYDTYTTHHAGAGSPKASGQMPTPRTQVRGNREAHFAAHTQRKWSESMRLRSAHDQCRMVACHARAEKSKEGTTRLLAILRSAEWRPEDFVGSIFCFCGERELEKEGSFTSSLAKWAKRRERRRPTVPPARTRCVSISVSTPQECVAVQVPFRRFQRYGLFSCLYTRTSLAMCFLDTWWKVEG